MHRVLLGWVGWVVLGCVAPTPVPVQTGQLPAFTVLTATPALGSLEFSGHDGLLEGSVVLDTPLLVSHPIRVAAVWLEPFLGTSLASQPLILQEGQQLLGEPFDGAAGTHAFSVALLPPPEAALSIQTNYPCALMTERYGEAKGAVVAFVDVNENGRLDLVDGPAVDHVLTATDFPFVLLGHSGGGLIYYVEACASIEVGTSGTRAPVFDDARLDLASCAQQGRFGKEEACGVAVYERPAVWFFGARDDETAHVGVGSQAGVRFTLDGEDVGSTDGERSLTIEAPGLTVGSHRLRAELAGRLPWEATFTLPDPTWFKAARRKDFASIEVDVGAVPGATMYSITVTQSVHGQSATPRVRLDTTPLGDAFVWLGVSFGDLPFRSSSSRKITLP